MRWALRGGHSATQRSRDRIKMGTYPVSDFTELRKSSCDFRELLGRGARRIGHRHRGAAIAPFARRDVDRHLPKQRNAKTLRLASASAVAEDVVAFPVTRAEEIAHVFDEPQHGHIYFGKHRARLA